jgi:hypothetical protein
MVAWSWFQDWQDRFQLGTTLVFWDHRTPRKLASDKDQFDNQPPDGN